jgi:hypothetical protein
MWSTLYWVVVGVGTVAFALDVGEAWSGREKDRFYRDAVVIYAVGLSIWFGIESLVVVLSRAIDPKRHFWAGAPTAIVAGAAIVFFGAHALAIAWEAIWPHEKRPRPVLQREPSRKDLALAEAYDDQWQAERRAAEHERRPQFADWQAEYLDAQKRRSEQA